MNRRWYVNRTNAEFVNYLSQTASISPLLAQILINRGIKTPSDTYAFLNPDINNISDPFDMPGMKQAVDRIMSAKQKGECVMVHGDYDADGITSTAILFSALEKFGIKTHYFIPDRMQHGYGFKSYGVERAEETGASLIITVDCGITSFEAVSSCRHNGIDIIITDHHEPALENMMPGTGEPENRRQEDSHLPRITVSPHHKFLLPDAVAVVNPKISDTQSPVSNLSGAGVAFKLVQALAMTCKNAGFSHLDVLDIAAVGTMADVVPLTFENRIIAKEGLKSLQNSARPGIKALRQVSGINGRTLKTGTVIFSIIPRINAAGRISDANEVVKLLLAESEEDALALALKLDSLNAGRQQIEEEVFQDALEQLNEKGVRSVIVLSSQGWHKGVIGIVASRIAEAYSRPTFIISEEGRMSRGSARSIPAFDICSALAECREVLEEFGGHKLAAGLSLETDKIKGFEELINRIANERLEEKDFTPALQIDAEAGLPDIGFSLIRDLELIEPFGCGNPEPVFGSRNLEMLYPRVVKDAHLKMKLRQRGQSIDAIGFDMASCLEYMGASIRVDAAYTPSINEWEGKQHLQLRLKALRPHR